MQGERERQRDRETERDRDREREREMRTHTCAHQPYTVTGKSPCVRQKVDCLRLAFSALTIWSFDYNGS